MATDWSRDRYATRQQRELLESAGVPHQKGRTRREADVLIRQLVQRGDLSKEHLPRPTEGQVELLKKLGAAIPEGLSVDEASRLIDEAKARTDPVTPASERQLKFIRELGGVPAKRMTRSEAGRFIDHLLEAFEVRCKKCGGRHNRSATRCDCGAFLPRLPPVRPPAHICRPTFFERLLSLFGG